MTGGPRSDAPSSGTTEDEGERIRIAENDEDLRACFPVLVQLRAHLSESAFLEQARRQYERGYRLALLERGGAVRAVAGFRLTETLFGGKHVYVDDLVTNASDRSAGFGGRLLSWLSSYARAAGCVAIELDSGVQRREAHRFYFREGMHVSSFRFRMSLADPAGEGSRPASLESRGERS